jgi:hypothetical protein
MWSYPGGPGARTLCSDEPDPAPARHERVGKFAALEAASRRKCAFHKQRQVVQPQVFLLIAPNPYFLRYNGVLPIFCGLTGGGTPWARSLKLAERLPAIPTGNGSSCVISRAVAYLHLLEFHLSQSSLRSACLGTPYASRHNVNC